MQRIRNNNGDDLPISANGPFTFSTPIDSGTTYGVTVSSQPAGQRCTVTNSNGTVKNAKVTTVSVSCVDAGVKCGGNFCGSGQGCCLPNSCQSLGACSAELECDDAADCSGGKICCGQFHNGNGNFEGATCQSSCGNVNNGIQLCTTNAECASNNCAPGQPGGYNNCQ